MRRSVIASICILMQVVVVAPNEAEAQPAHKIKRAQPATTSRASPEMTGSIAIAASKGSVGKTPSSVLANVPDPTAPDDGALPPDFDLPVASRARMRACGERWRKMKLDGEAGDEIWRDFASTCLSAKFDPTPSETKAPVEKTTSGLTSSNQPGEIQIRKP